MLTNRPKIGLTCQMTTLSSLEMIHILIKKTIDYQMHCINVLQLFKHHYYQFNVHDYA